MQKYKKLAGYSTNRLSFVRLIPTFSVDSVKVLSTVGEVQNLVSNARTAGKIVGLVPTMGALHDGHLTLVHRATEACDLTVVSIFVNPTQFNEAQDFNAYPRTVDQDVRLLEDTGCQVVFHPPHQEVYPKPDQTTYAFGALETRYEGAHRPGHFSGVGMVVKRLFEIVQPHKAFFGLKDYQQVLVIRSLVHQFNLGVEVVAVPTVREPDGLAMSSRNLLLGEEERREAAEIYRVLVAVKAKSRNLTPTDLIDYATAQIDAQKHLSVEYFGIADPDTLAPIEDLQSADHAIALTAVRAGQVRLIDNLQLF